MKKKIKRETIIVRLCIACLCFFAVLALWMILA